MSGAENSFWCERAWLPEGVADRVRVEVAGGRITALAAGQASGAEDVRLPGVTLPGFANAHSHAFHRALRGRTHDAGGTFWTWRDRMYAVAARLDPDNYRALATAAFAEMALAGVTCVGEFHYVHHAPDGTPYDDPNAMGEAIRQAAQDAGIRLTLLDTCYLASGITGGPAGGPVGRPAGGRTGGGAGQPLRPEQIRFGDGDADRWAERVSRLKPDASTRIGVAIHSVRAVPAAQIPAVVAASGDGPLHVHLSEQSAENEACRTAYGRTPTELLHDQGALTPRTTVVHATHLTGTDIALLGEAGVGACFCPTTERDLADGIGPARALSDAGVSLSLGSDQHAIVDLLEESRALEMHERLATGQRGRFTPSDLVDSLTWRGHAALGWPDAGRIEPGARCDLTAVRLDTVRTAGSDPAQIVLAATTADVDTVVVDGRVVVQRGEHYLGDVGRLLATAIEEVTRP